MGEVWCVTILQLNSPMHMSFDPTKDVLVNEQKIHAFVKNYALSGNKVQKSSF